MLGGLNGRRFIQISFVVDIEFAKRILQAEDLALLELWIFSAAAFISQERMKRTSRTYFCNLIIFMLAVLLPARRSRWLLAMEQ
jgi:hypothetical protein